MPAAKGVRLQKRGGVWYFRWPGDRGGKSTGTRDSEVAEAALVVFLQEKGAGVLTGDTLLAGTALDHYLDEHVRNDQRAGTPVVGKDTVENAAKFLRQHFGDMPVAHISPSDVNDPKDGYIAKRRDGRIVGIRRDGQPFGPAGDWLLRRELGVLIAAFNHETRQREPGATKARLGKAEVPFIPLPPEPPGKDRWLEDDERLALIAACPVDTRVYFFTWIALEAPARRRAIETLTVFQVDLQRRLIDFNPAGRRQTKKRRPVVPISDELFPVISRAVELAKEAGTEYVLGKPVKRDTPASVRKAFESAVERAGLEKVTPHTLRHTWATRALQRGVSTHDVAEVLGDDERTVRKRYSHHAPNYLRDAINFRQAPVQPKERADG